MIARQQKNVAMKSIVRTSGLLCAALIVACVASTQQGGAGQRSYLGFDRNIYPGDDALPILRKTFAFSSFWLSPPPGETRNSWTGKRGTLLKNGFGFVVLHRGRDSRELKNTAAAGMGLLAAGWCRPW